MSRSFTIESIHTTNGKLVRFTGGRFVSATPASAARKIFSRVYRESKGRGPMTLKVAVRETTRSNEGKVFTYNVMRVAQKRQVERDGQLITYNFTTKVKKAGRAGSRKAASKKGSKKGSKKSGSRKPRRKTGSKKTGSRKPRRKAGSKKGSRKY
jgi:hypothetical protein